MSKKGGIEKPPRRLRSEDRRGKRAPEDPEEAATVRPRWWLPYFASLSQHGSHWQACEDAHCSESAPTKYLQNNPDLRPEFEEEKRRAKHFAGERLKAGVMNRAVEGVQKPVIYQGKITSWYTEYDVTREALMLNALLPEEFKYRGDRSEVLNLTPADLKGMTDEELRIFTSNGGDMRPILAARSKASAE